MTTIVAINNTIYADNKVTVSQMQEESKEIFFAKCENVFTKYPNTQRVWECIEKFDPYYNPEDPTTTPEYIDKVFSVTPFVLGDDTINKIAIAGTTRMIAPMIGISENHFNTFTGTKESLIATLHDYMQDSIDLLRGFLEQVEGMTSEVLDQSMRIAELMIASQFILIGKKKNYILAWADMVRGATVAPEIFEYDKDTLIGIGSGFAIAQTLYANDDKKNMLANMHDFFIADNKQLNNKEFAYLTSEEREVKLDQFIKVVNEIDQLTGNHFTRY